MDEETIDIILTNLKVISQLKLNEKLSIRKGHLCIDYSSNFQFIKRWFFRDSRDIVLIYIRELIRNIQLIFSKISENAWMLTRILTELDESMKGLLNLKKTYSSDPYMTATLETVILKFTQLSQHGRTMLI